MPLFTKGKPPTVVESPAAPTDPADRGEPIPPSDPALEQAIRRIGGEFLERARKRKAGILSTAFWSDKLMNWAMQDEAFKVQLFRFVDAFPRLTTPEQVHEHLVDYLGQPGVTLPPGLGVGLKAGGLLKGAMTKTITSQITSMAEKFIAGTDAASAQRMLKKLWGRGIAFSVDLLGEACVSDAEAEAYRRTYHDLVRDLPDAVADWKRNELLESDHLGPIPRANVSIKITAFRPELDPIDTDGAVAALTEILRPILETAREKNVLINFDMEQGELKDLTLELFMRCCEAVDFPAGLAMQAYLRSGDDDARRIIAWSRAAGRRVTVRLVKGAYWDYETIHAEEMHWPIPVWSRKTDTDACFERMTAAFIEACPRSPGEGGVTLALGSHNARSIAHALALLERASLPPSAVEIQMLHGMGDDLKAAAVDMGLRLREYVPVGEMIPGMAYLVRRLLENTSNESWLRAGFFEQASVDDLLASPHRRYATPDPGVERVERAPERHRLTPAVPGVGNGRPFSNEPPRDFARRDRRDRFREAIASVTPPAASVDATNGDAERAPAEAERALAEAAAALPAWQAQSPIERSTVLVNAARIMRRRRDELCGLIIREVGKTWRDSDAEVCEAIDLCEYYARQAVGLFEPQRLGRFVGELNQIVHRPRGTAVVISPWGAPLSGMVGMSTAALVTGNPTIINPAPQALGVGRTFFDILLEAGCPRDVVHWVPGDLGSALVRDPRTALIVFTGSRDAGLGIIEAAGRVAPGQTHVKKVLAEMAGKNAIIVDESADLDEAVLAVRRGAFGFQGQKGSACSQAIVHASCYDLFLERLCASTQTITIGDPIDPAVTFGPVIDRAAWTRINAAVEAGRHKAHLALAVDLPDDRPLAAGRDYVPPHIFAEVPPDSSLARDVILGPVLSVMKAESFAAAVALANATSYASTGSVYSRKPANIESARRALRVGNLYVNRGCTGALVGRQPFGGSGLSGVGAKAGGAAYLDHFVEPVAICENTMRRGFAPEL